jgi:hypothetical protein
MEEIVGYHLHHQNLPIGTMYHLLQKTATALLNRKKVLLLAITTVLALNLVIFQLNAKI